MNRERKSGGQEEIQKLRLLREKAQALHHQHQSTAYRWEEMLREKERSLNLREAAIAAAERELCRQHEEHRRSLQSFLYQLGFPLPRLRTASPVPPPDKEFSGTQPLRLSLIHI